MIRDYHTPAGKELTRDLNTSLGPYIRSVSLYLLRLGQNQVPLPFHDYMINRLTSYSFLEQCRPLSVSMGNAIKAVKHEITHEIPNDMNEDDV